MRLTGLIMALLAVSLLAGSGRSAAQGTEVCGTTGPRVCVLATATPETVSPSRPDSPSYLEYAVVVTNRAMNNVTHAALEGSLPSAYTLVSLEPSVCTSDGSGGIACNFGSIAAGASIQVDIVVQVPETEGTASASFGVSFDEGPNDNGSSDPKQDTVSTTVTTKVDAIAGVGSTFVPEGASVELTTDPTGTGIATSSDPLVADAAITSAPTSLTALLEEVPGPLSCPKNVVCRRGDWIHASIPGSFDPPLAFPTRWDKTLIPSALNSKKFAFLITECLNGCPINVVSRRCSSATPAASELPCLWNVARMPDGDWVGTLINSHNGFFH
jgi:Domain of unknown function DUF11